MLPVILSRHYLITVNQIERSATAIGVYLHRLHVSECSRIYIYLYSMHAPFPGLQDSVLKHTEVFRTI